ncbi:MAG TPA: efflux RND transporter periplasmic adaptor subunit [Terriglobia bacterium]|nr:efflux RND transporter periplasmic adaptor subunit [Terriglobia bacterium]
MKKSSVLKLKHIVWALSGVVVIVLLVAVTHSGAKPTAQLPPPPDVEVAPVEQRDVPIYGEWIGTLQGLVTANVKAQVTGYLLTRDYKEGSYVRKGQLLFQIDPRPFEAALAQAKGNLAQAGAQLVEDKAQLATAEANQLKSQLDVDKYAPLAKAEAASQQDLDNAVQTNLANKAQVQGAKAAITAAMAQIQADEATVQTASINLGFTQITSPINGIAGIAQAQVGDLVSVNSSPLTTVSTLNPMRDYFTVSEQAYLELQKRFATSDPARWKLQLILADGTTFPHEGQFYFADRAIDQNTGSIELAGLFPNPGNILRPGQYGKVRAVVRMHRGALLVPQPAINQLQGSYEVDVVGSGNRIATRPVKVGAQVGTMWVVLDGLKRGERVVVEGGAMLRPGMQVQPTPYKGSDE